MVQGCQIIMLMSLWHPLEQFKRYPLHQQYIQGPAKRWSPGLVNFVPAVAYQSCLALPAVFTQPSRALYFHYLGEMNHQLPNRKSPLLWMYLGNVMPPETRTDNFLPLLLSRPKTATAANVRNSTVGTCLG